MSQDVSRASASSSPQSDANITVLNSHQHPSSTGLELMDTPTTADNHTPLYETRTRSSGHRFHTSSSHNQELLPILSSTSTGKPSADDDASDHHHHTPASAPGTASPVQVAINIVVSMVGAALLGVPSAFQQAGWLLGSITLCVVSALNVYAMLLLPQVKAKLILMNNTDTAAATTTRQSPEQQQRPASPLSYGDLGRSILGPQGEILVNVALGISQAGFATAYIIFIAANLQATWHLPRDLVCLACVPGLALLVQFRQVQSLSPFSLVANVSNAGALTAVLVQDYFSYQEQQPETTSSPSSLSPSLLEAASVDSNNPIEAVKWGGFLFVIAITIYSMEGVGLILSLEASAKNRAGFNGLFKTMLTGITLFMAVFGSAGYWAFGEYTKAPITLNLGNHWAATFVKCALCLGLYFT
jgi:proton-coupled amino acid transporter